MKLYWIPSRGYGSRGRYGIDFIVLHYTWGHKAGDLATLTSKQASSHFYITTNGDIYWLVRFENRAYHAGINRALAPKRFARIRPNERSIGIEIEGFGEYTEEQYRALDWCLPLVMERYGIPLHFVDDTYRGCNPKKAADRYEIEVLENFRGILAHGNIHGSKTDPGMNFDWGRFKRLRMLPNPGCLTRAETIIYRGDPSMIPPGGIDYEFRMV